ncbi:helix-turn-helix domain-containing protein [Janibacter limosus]|uniref:PucR family transcriptional regulator n=1 Tax=Janibacter limosus TaxID=53458 RepID=UPI0035DED38C|nr:helix-turn-helix domain-containing protein [Janibacter limosus]
MTNLDDALQDLSEAVQQRLVVLDEGMRVIAYSIHESEPDRARLSHLLAHSDTRQAPAAGTDGVGTHTASDGTQWVLHPLRDDRHRVGHLLHVRAKGVPSPPEDVLTEGAAQLGVLLSLRTMYAERDAARARGLLTELLGEHSTEIGRASAARALVDEELVGSAGQYCAVVLAVPPGHPGGDWEARRAVDATLDFVSRTSTATVVGGVVEGLGVPVFPRPVVQDRLERVLGAPGLAHVRAGIGGVVDDLLSVATSHEQARRARRAACLDPLTHPRVTEWSGLGIDKLLLALPPDRLDLDDLPEPVTRLIASDHREVDVPTLEAYLDAGGDAQASAVAPGIHRSTLYYRLTRIRETTRADLGDGRVRRDLHTGLRVARLAGLLSG